MKKTLFILLFALLFENVFLGPSPLAKRIARVGKIYREKKLRELQNSDESQAQDTDKGTEEPQGENTTADAPAIIVDVSVPVSTKGYKKKKSSPSSSSSSSTRPATSLKINKFYNYVAPPEQPKVIRYNTLFSFLNVIIAFTIRLRLRIAYSFGRLRNLQDDESAAESVPSTCYINNPELAGKNGTGANIKYDCNATTTYNATDITNVTINTDVPLKADNQSFSFENVTFNGNSSEEAANLVEATDQVEGDPIDIRDADITVEEDKVVFTGTVAGDEGASTAKAMYDVKETFTMLLSNFTSEEERFEEYDCQISSYTADGDNGKVDMTCKTPNKNLKNPNAFNFDDSLSIGERVVTLHMKEGVSTPVNWEVVSTDTDKTTDATKTDAVNNISYRKNSSGLSGGAIAGIVIACAVVLIAASIVAMMLRKPAPPLDNTTVVGLKTVDNY